MVLNKGKRDFFGSRGEGGEDGVDLGVFVNLVVRSWESFFSVDFINYVE